MSQQTGIEVFNKFAVGTTGEQLVFIAGAVPRTLSKPDALLLAAYLVALADDSEQHAQFRAVLLAVECS